MEPRTTVATANLLERINEWVGLDKKGSKAVKDLIWALAMDEELQEDFNTYVNAQRADINLERIRAEQQWEAGKAADGPYGRIT